MINTSYTHVLQACIEHTYILLAILKMQCNLIILQHDIFLKTRDSLLFHNTIWKFWDIM